jgi:murein DD-endopeptidase MepM/ murein hydrolase activator NlpD
MHIILVADHGSAPKSFSIGPAHIVGLGFVLVSALIGIVMTVQGIIQTVSGDDPKIANGGVPHVTDVGPTLNMMAAKLGEMEAQLLRLDTFSDRLSKLIGPRSGQTTGSPSVLPNVSPSAPNPPSANPAGTVEQPNVHSNAAPTIEMLRGQLVKVAAAIEDRTTRINRLESAVVEVRTAKQSLPTIPPITSGYHSSDFGSRIDPFDGKASFHAGIDFVAPTGTQFASAASGIVVSTRQLPDFGNVIEIDHGNGLHSLYAHASRILVQQGELVLKGQTIGQVGTTGRSTGPHLHFEVHENGHPINPQKFLNLDS